MKAKSIDTSPYQFKEPQDLDAFVLDVTDVPSFQCNEFHLRASDYVVLIPVLNQGEILINQLRRMQESGDITDIVIIDAGSTDGSTKPSVLKSLGVRALLTTNRLGLGTALRIGLAYGLNESYSGFVTVDGNGKDGVEKVPTVVERLRSGVDLVQCSRFISGGLHKNTPVDRFLGIKLVICPLLWLRTGFCYTDPTNGFKGLSKRFILDKRLRPLRKELTGFNFQFYLNYAAPKLGFSVVEIPATRVYPDSGPIPTKIVGLLPRVKLVLQFLRTVVGGYDP